MSYNFLRSKAVWANVDMKTVLKELQGFAKAPLETPTTDVDAIKISSDVQSSQNQI